MKLSFDLWAPVGDDFWHVCQRSVRIPGAATSILVSRLLPIATFFFVIYLIDGGPLA
jgi:hypothetical protein